MSLYLATCGPFVKVGTSCDPEQRVAGLNRPSGRASVLCPAELPSEPLVLRAVWPGSDGGEHRLKKALQAVPNAHVIGEWFVASPALLVAIADLLDVPLDLLLVGAAA